MQGFQIVFFTEQDRRIEGTQPVQWLLELAKELGIKGSTVFTGAESVGKDGKRHSVHFFELTDQPVEVMMAVSEDEARKVFERINVTDTRLFIQRRRSSSERLVFKAPSHSVLSELN
jgi:PII-like signaling protein